MNSLVQYYDSDEERNDALRTVSLPVELDSSTPLHEDIENPISTPKPFSLGLTSLPAPKKHAKRRRLPIVSETDEDKEASSDISKLTDTNGDASAKTSTKTEIDQNREKNNTDSTANHVVETPQLSINDEVQGPSAVPSFEPPPLPHIMFRGRIVPPPPGLVPPAGLKVNGNVDVSSSGMVEDLPHDWVAGLRKGNIMELSQDDLRRFELSRPVDPLNASRGELIQSEIAAGLWTSKQGQLLSTAQATFNQSRRHHINSMATTAALMEESIRQQASVGQDRRRMAKAKYGW